MFACVKVAWADSYTITFKTGSGAGTQASTSTACSAIVSSGSEYLSGNLVTANYVYYSAEGGLKISGNNNSGTIKMNLSSAITPTSIVVRARKYDSSQSATIFKINGTPSEGVSISSSFTDIVFDITTEISYIEMKSTSKPTIVQSVTIYYDPPCTDPGTFAFSDDS